MVSEIKESMEQGRVFFGIKQCLKKSDELERAIISSDCREEIKNLLVANKIDFEVSELTKEDISGRLEMDFESEVFGLRRDLKRTRGDNSLGEK